MQLLCYFHGFGPKSSPCSHIVLEMITKLVKKKYIWLILVLYFMQIASLYQCGIFICVSGFENMFKFLDWSSKATAVINYSFSIH